MTAGLFIYEADGVTERFGPNTRNGTVLGVHTTGKANGSITDARFSRGVPVILSVLAVEFGTFVVPDIVISGNTLSWTFATNSANWNTPVRIVYGYHA